MAVLFGCTLPCLCYGEMHMQGLPKIIAVIGPTASGKTALGERIAIRFSGEIISADAKQVYRRMDIGTAKEKELAVAQHLIDIREPEQVITVGQYQSLAYGTIDALLENKVLPVLVGGSGLYAESVLEGYVFTGPGKRDKKPRYQSLKMGIAVDRDELKARVYQRIKDRAKSGLPEEVAALLAEGVSPEWLEACGLEYRYFSRYVRGHISLEETIGLTAIATNQFIKRQYTWWRRHEDIIWVHNYAQAEALVAEFIT